MGKWLILGKTRDESGYLAVQESKEVLKNSFRKKRKKKKKTERKEGKKQKTPKSWLLLYINGI